VCARADSTAIRNTEEDATMANARKRRKNGSRRRARAQDGPRRHADIPVPAATHDQPPAGEGPTAVWGDLNQRVMQDFADLWLRGARESTRALTRVQAANLEAWREAQGAAFRWLRRGVGGAGDGRGTGTSRAA
jgi:hypothetical protein